jgi:hypothetical protein
MALRLRRGLNTDRLNMIPEEGEIIYVTDYAVAEVSPLWVGDGVTTGGVAAGATTLDELQDVQISGLGGVSLADGQALVYDGTIWRNTREFSVNSAANAIKHTREATSADGSTQTRTALIVSKKITDISTTAIGDHGGPAISFNAETANSSSSQIFAQVAGLYNDTSGTHDIAIFTSDDNFTSASEVYIGSSARTNINNGVLYVDKTTNRVGVNTIGPLYDLDINGTVRATGSILGNVQVGLANDNTVTTSTGNLILDSDAGTTQVNDNLSVSGDVTANGATLGNIQVGLTDNTITTSSGDLTISSQGVINVSNDLFVNSGYLKTLASTAYLYNTNATAIQIGSTASTITIPGNLTVNGTTTTINSTTVSVDDKNIELGSVTTPTDITADGGGITLRGTTNKTITWQSSNDKWNFNKGLYITGDLVTSAGSNTFLGNGTFANGATYAISANGTSGDVGIGNDLYVYGDQLKLNASATNGVDVNIIVKRNTTDAYLRWTELGTYWRTSHEFRCDGDIWAGDDLFVKGDNVKINADQSTDITAGLEINRPVANNSVFWRWNETDKNWQPTNTNNDNTLNSIYAAGDIASGSTIYGSKVIIDQQVAFDTATLTLTAGATDTILSTDRNVNKALIYIKDTTTDATHAVEALVLRTPTGAKITTYGELYSASSLATFSADIDGSNNLRLRVTSTSTNSLSISAVRTSLS